jgi:twitching motility protein PilT
MLEKILRAAAERGASDIHVKADDVIRARVDGRLIALTRQPLSAEQTRAVAMALVTDEKDRARLDAVPDHDCSYALEGRAVPRQHHAAAGDALGGAPPHPGRRADARRARAAGGGGAHRRGGARDGARDRRDRVGQVEHAGGDDPPRERARRKHVVTLENPIEFVHTDIRSSVTQREVGLDTESFRRGSARRSARTPT